MTGLQWPSPGSMSLRMTRNMVKLSTSVTLKELRSPPVSGREKLIMSARMMRMLGSTSVMKGLRYLMLRETCRHRASVRDRGCDTNSPQI